MKEKIYSSLIAAKEEIKQMPIFLDFLDSKWKVKQNFSKNLKFQEGSFLLGFNFQNKIKKLHKNSEFKGVPYFFIYLKQEHIWGEGIYSLSFYNNLGIDIDEEEIVFILEKFMKEKEVDIIFVYKKSVFSLGENSSEILKMIHIINKSYAFGKSNFFKKNTNNIVCKFSNSKPYNVKINLYEKHIKFYNNYSFYDFFGVESLSDYSLNFKEERQKIESLYKKIESKLKGHFPSKKIEVSFQKQNIRIDNEFGRDFIFNFSIRNSQFGEGNTNHQVSLFRGSICFDTLEELFEYCFLEIEKFSVKNKLKVLLSQPLSAK